MAEDRRIRLASFALLASRVKGRATRRFSKDGSGASCQGVETPACTARASEPRALTALLDAAGSPYL